MPLSTPALPAVQTANSDTIMVTVTSIDAAATHVDVYLQQTAPVAVAAVLASHTLKAVQPIEITNLAPGAAYTVTAKAWSTTDVSASSAGTSVTVPRLWVFGHVSTTAAGVSGVRVDIGRLPEAGRYFPSAYIGPYGGFGLRTFETVLVVWQGKNYARMPVQLYAQPNPKIRNGEFVCMTLSQDIGGGFERWAPILYNALVREDAATYIASTTTGLNDFFDNEYFGADYFADDIFA